MKTSSTPMMRKLLARGLNMARQAKKPRKGSLHGLFTKKLNNGWYYQVDLMRESRISRKVFVAVYGFKPPITQEARSADVVLSEPVS